MLQITGKTLGVDTEERNGPTGSFMSTTITVLVEQGADSQVYRLRAGRDLRTSDWPKVGDVATLNVAVSAYNSKNGPGVQLTAVGRQHTAAKAA